MPEPKPISICRSAAIRLSCRPISTRAVVYSNTNRPMQALADFDRVLQLDSTNSFTYFNRAILRTQIGDYNRALDDFDRVALYSPGNVQVYYLRAMLKTRLATSKAPSATTPGPSNSTPTSPTPT